MNENVCGKKNVVIFDSTNFNVRKYVEPTNFRKYHWKEFCVIFPMSRGACYASIYKLHHFTGNNIVNRSLFLAFQQSPTRNRYSLNETNEKKVSEIRKNSWNKSKTSKWFQSLYLSFHTSITYDYKLLPLYLYANCMQLDYYLEYVCVCVCTVCTLCCSCYFHHDDSDCKTPHFIPHMPRY